PYTPRQAVRPDHVLLRFGTGPLATTLEVEATPIGAPILTLEPGPLLSDDPLNAGPSPIGETPAPPAVLPAFDLGPVAVGSPALPLKIRVRNRADATVPLEITDVTLFALGPPGPFPLRG